MNVENYLISITDQGKSCNYQDILGTVLETYCQSVCFYGSEGISRHTRQKCKTLLQCDGYLNNFNPFTALAGKISGMKDAGTCLQTVHFLVL